MDEKKLKLIGLDLQLFADPNSGNPTENEDDGKEKGKENEIENKNLEKKFTQEDLNRINIKGKEESKKAIYKILGISNDEELQSLTEKLKNYDSQKAELENYKAKEVKDSYLNEIRRNNIADEYVETVYYAVQPKENEKVEDYNNRVEEYIKTHKMLLKQPSGKNFGFNYDYSGNAHQEKNNVGLRDALKMKYGK